MEGKKVSESAVLTAQLMSPQDANAAGNVHGGVIMKLIIEGREDLQPSPLHSFKCRISADASPSSPMKR
jgi:hypothetical protein